MTGKRFVLYIFLGLVFPILVFAQGEDALLLSEKDTKIILNALQGEISRLGSTIEVFDYSSQQQAALTLFRSSSREAILKFMPGFVGTETLKAIINVASSLQKSSTMTIGKILEEIENQTVKGAIAIGTDWLLQNEVKTGSGDIESTYWNYNNNQVKANFQYILIYQSRGSGNGLVVLKFYSADQIDMPRATISAGGSFGFVGDSPSIGIVRPFIIQIEAMVERYALGWMVDSSTDTKITVEFPEKVPILKLSKELPYPFEEQKIKLLNYLNTARRIFDVLQSIGSEALGKTADFAHKAKETVKGVIIHTSQLLAKSGALLVDPFSKESQQIAFIESQLDLVKETLDAKEAEVKLSRDKDVAKAVENSARPSFPQEQPTFKQASEPILDLVKEEQELIPAKEEVFEQTKSDLVSEEKVKLSSVKDEINLGETKDCEVDPLQATALGDVVINEVAWMGTPQSANDEWIELHSKSSVSVSLNGWRLRDKSDHINIVFDSSHTLTPNGFFLLERTNDTTVPNFTADLIYTGALSNSDEALYLFDHNCVLRDKVATSPDWPGGDNTSKKSMERNNHNLEWYTYDGQGFGSPRQTNGRDMLADYRPLVNVSFQAGISGGGPPAPQSQNSNACEPNSIDVNTASMQDLEKLQGIGPVLAQGIIDERAVAPFSSLDDLARVSGIAEGKVNGIKEQGCAYVNLPEPVGSSDPTAPSDDGAEPEPEPQAQDTTPSEEPPAEEQLLEDPQSEEQPPAQDTIPPAVTLNPLDSSQDNITFSLGWTITDSGGEASPSGVQSIFIEYAITPSASGVFAQYDNNGVWTDWQTGSAGKITLGAQAVSLSLRAQDGVSYAFQISASDVAGNVSAASSAFTSVALSKTVVINEIAWMGTTASFNDEWVEFYNATDTTIDLSGWRLVADDGTPTIEFPQGESITANGYFLLERTDDTTISNILADLIYTGALGNEGETLRLYDAENNLIDIVDASSDWFFGDNTTKQTMERIDTAKAGSDPANWASNNRIKYNNKDAGNNWINGTPGQTNSTATSSTTISELRFDEFSSLTLTALGSPYITTAGIISITVPAGKTLVVEPGVTVKFADNRGKLTVQGTLKAQGTQTSGVTFTNDGGAIWCGIKVASTSADSQLDYVTIDKAQSTGSSYCNESVNYAMYVDSSVVAINNSVIQTGSYHRKLYLKNSSSTINASTISGANLNTESVGIYIDGGSPTISNSTISNNSIGIFVNSLVNNPTIQSNTFAGNTYAVKLESAGALLSGNAATNNTYNGIFFEGAVLSNMTWQADTMPYIVNKFTVSAGTTLIIQAGTAVKFVNTPYTDSGITVQGTLITQGIQSNPVSFAGITDATTWKRIYIAPGSTGSQLAYTTITKGGNTYNEAALYVKQSNVQLSNVTILNSAYSGIYSFNGTITGSDVTLSNNTYGFHIQTGDCPALSTVTITGTPLHPSSAICSF